MLTSIFFFFNDTATTEIYTLSLHDALPIFETIAEAISHQKERTLRDPCGLEHRIVGGIVLLLNRGATYLGKYEHFPVDKDRTVGAGTHRVARKADNSLYE